MTRFNKITCDHPLGDSLEVIKVFILLDGALYRIVALASNNLCQMGKRK